MDIKSSSNIEKKLDIRLVNNIHVFLENYYNDDYFNFCFLYLTHILKCNDAYMIYYNNNKEYCYFIDNEIYYFTKQKIDENLYIYSVFTVLNTAIIFNIQIIFEYRNEQWFIKFSHFFDEDFQLQYKTSSNFDIDTKVDEEITNIENNFTILFNNS